MIKSAAKKLALVCAGLLVGVLGAELIARFIAPEKSADLLFNASDSAPNLYIIDSQTRLAPAPNLLTHIQSLDYSIPFRTNELGLRGPPLAETSGIAWIALGDSFTMSVQVKEQETFINQLGELRGVHIWNAGVDGFSTWQANLRLQQLQLSLKPEVAVLTFFTGNDYQDNERFLAMKKHPLPGKIGLPIPRKEVPTLTRWLLAHSHLYAHYRIRQAQHDINDPQNPTRANWRDELAIFSTIGETRLKQLTPITRSALERFKAICEYHKITPLVAIAPPAFVVDEARLDATFRMVGIDPSTAVPEQPQQQLIALLKQLSIPYCDLSGALKQAPTPSYLTFDGHWSVHGHQTVAEQLNRCLTGESQ